jgi:hypothetical protein
MFKILMLPLLALFVQGLIIDEKTYDRLIEKLEHKHQSIFLQEEISKEGN